MAGRGDRAAGTLVASFCPFICPFIYSGRSGLAALTPLIRALSWPWATNQWQHYTLWTLRKSSPAGQGPGRVDMAPALGDGGRKSVPGARPSLSLPTRPLLASVLCWERL